MPLEFVTVRRVDDHSVTAKVGRSAVQHMAGWEVVPGDGDTTPPDRPAGTAASAPPAENPQAEPAATAPAEPADFPPARKRRPAASTDSKE